MDVVYCLSTYAEDKAFDQCIEENFGLGALEIATASVITFDIATPLEEAAEGHGHKAPEEGTRRGKWCARWRAHPQWHRAPAARLFHGEGGLASGFLLKEVK